MDQMICGISVICEQHLFTQISPIAQKNDSGTK
jgi:hypothetical protein